MPIELQTRKNPAFASQVYYTVHDLQKRGFDAVSSSISKLFKVGDAVLTQRTYIILGQILTLVHIAAHLANSVSEFHLMALRAFAKRRGCDFPIRKSLV